ncbi:hypothetical protein [Bradyrhizobium lupini]|uniref:hypothetical protein n=1 Tax=Rhizobium lupini TaxID=136996 RepID=UPI0034C6783B
MLWKAQHAMERRKLLKKKFRQRVLGKQPADGLQREQRMGLHQVALYRKGTVSPGVSWSSVAMPENFCLIENYEEVSQFLRLLRHRLDTQGQRLERMRVEGKRIVQSSRLQSYIDFATMKRITPVTALVLASEYDRAIAVFGVDELLRAVNLHLWEPEVHDTLKDVGFLNLLKVEDARSKLQERNGIYTIPFIAGSKVRGEMIERLIKGLGELAGSSGVADGETLLGHSRVYDGLGEAIQNVQDHAYPDWLADASLAKKWWMTGAVEPSKKRFTIAIYDHGISIPVSLPRWTKYDEFRANVARTIGGGYNPTDSPHRDGETIAKAMELGRSSTGKDHHGKGLPVIRDIIDNCRGGTVRIISRNGTYTCTAGEDPKHASHALPLRGTLVEWEMLL